MAAPQAHQDLDPETIARIALALEEDHAHRDLSTLWTVPADADAEGALYARQGGLFCGGGLFVETFRQLHPRIEIVLLAPDGSRLVQDQVAARFRGSARGILSAERVALNLVGRFSGIATLTARFVEAIRGTSAVVCDTRKTLPLWRQWDKYAVRVGGGTNHRSNLEEMVLLKDNHLALAGGPIPALRSVKAQNKKAIPVEVEVDTLEQLRELLDEGVERVLLDNMTLAQMREAVAMAGGRAKLEASGGVRLETIREIAETGVDFISVGALTHSPPAFDFSLEIIPLAG
jgi:nicotinate-nucleotide pyrophosphorylase (carboxylating)